jgi:hypothetical protein
MHQAAAWQCEGSLLRPPSPEGDRPVFTDQGATI